LLFCTKRFFQELQNGKTGTHVSFRRKIREKTASKRQNIQAGREKRLGPSGPKRATGITESVVGQGTAVLKGDPQGDVLLQNALLVPTMIHSIVSSGLVATAGYRVVLEGTSVRIVQPTTAPQSLLVL
jgi:hypothetical protein